MSVDAKPDTAARPKGHSVKPASLKAWIPKGMPMMVAIITTPPMA